MYKKYLVLFFIALTMTGQNSFSLGVSDPTYTFSEERISNCTYNCGGDIIEIQRIHCYFSFWGICTETNCPPVYTVCGFWP